MNTTTGIFLLFSLISIAFGEIRVYEEEEGDLEYKVDNVFLEYRKNQILNDAIYLFDGESSNGCGKVGRPPNIVSLSDQRPSWILLMNHDRTDDECGTADKIINVQKAGYEGLVMVSQSSSTDIELLRINEKLESKFNINLSFIRNIDGINLRQFAVKTRHSKRYTVEIGGFKKPVPTTTTTPRPPTTTSRPPSTPPTDQEKIVDNQPTPVPPKVPGKEETTTTTIMLYGGLMLVAIPLLYELFTKCSARDIMAMSGAFGIAMMLYAVSKQS